MGDALHGGSLSALVLSDLHATSEPPGKDTTPSHFTTSPGRSHRLNPFASFEQTLQDEGITSVDLVLCPGDLTDQADPDGLTMCWEKLDGLARHLGAELVATTGNHDMDSRQKFDVHPRAQLVELTPPFPTRTDEGRLTYWTYDYSVVETAAYRVVTINSCALHGYGSKDSPEYERGRYRRTVGDSIKARLSGSPFSPDLNILLVHHHLQQLPTFDTTESSTMIDAQDLVGLLEATGRWVVIHGHKHRAHVSWAGGGGGAPVLISAGSFAARLHGSGPEETRLRNQAHLVTFASPNTRRSVGLDAAGEIRSWTFDAVSGWHLPAPYPEDGLPGRSGFGWHASPHGIAELIHAALLGAPGTTLTREELLSVDSKLAYVSAVDLAGVTTAVASMTPAGVLKLDADGLLESAYLIGAPTSGA